MACHMWHPPTPSSKQVCDCSHCCVLTPVAAGVQRELLEMELWRYKVRQSGCGGSSLNEGTAQELPVLLSGLCFSLLFQGTHTSV